MKTLILNKDNMNPKTGEMFTDYLKYSEIFSGRLTNYILFNRDVFRRLHSCKAWTYDKGMYTYLISYNTVVGMLDRHTGVFYDALRTEYGYTATSAQHIRKFCNDYAVWSIVRYVD